MTTQYTPILQLALPVTGELNGTWGDVVNDNITSMVEEAIAGLATISTWTTNAHTLTTADGVTDEARCAMLVLQTGAGGTALSGAGQVICPALTKLYVVKNDAAYAVTVKTSGGSGVAIAAGDTAFVFCDGTNVNACVTQIINGHITGNLTVDGNTTLGDSSADTVVINAGSTTLNDGGAIRFEDNAGGEYVALKAPATIAASFTLTLPIDDGVNGQALITDGAGNLSWSTAASGDVYGPASATDTAVALFDGTTGKLIKNSTVTVASDGATVIAANSTSDGLRITQIGSGNALLVEDSANPDSTPFVITGSGNVGVGTTSPSDLINTYSATNNTLLATGDSTVQFLGRRASNDSSGPVLILQKTRGTISALTINSDGDHIGDIYFRGYDGTSSLTGAQISAYVDGTPGTNDMPGRLVFSTTADGASSPTERMRINSSGNIGIGGSAGTNVNLYNLKDITGSATAYSYYTNNTVKSGVTNAYGYRSLLSTEAASFTLSTLAHFRVGQGTIGAGSSVTTQYAYYCDDTLTGATNNYGFFSNIASGTGRWNFYAAGTADNYFAGRVGIGGTASSAINLALTKDITGATTAYGMYSSGAVQSDVTARVDNYLSLTATAAAAFTLTEYNHFRAQSNALGAGSAITNQFGFYASAGLTTATNNYGFYSNIASGTGRWNFYAGGTADNYFAGSVGIGAAPDANFKTTITGTTSTVVGINGSNSLAAALAIRATNAAAYPALSLSSWVTWTTAKDVGQFRFDGLSSTGTYAEYAAIYATAGTNTATGAPTYLTFRTSDGTNNAATERMRIDSAGNVGIGATANPYVKLAVGGTLPSSSSSTYSVGLFGTSPSATTAQYISYESSPTTQAASFTLSNFTHFRAYQAGFGAGSTVTNQHGFYAFNNLTGATNNFGFYSGIAAGSGRYNFYAAGSADNYFAGRVGMGTGAGTNVNLIVGGSMTGNTSQYGIYSGGVLASDVTVSGRYFTSSATTAAAAFTLPELMHFSANQAALGAGSTVTNQHGFNASANLTGATNNYGFISNIASGTGRWNFYVAGSAANYFAGQTFIGNASTIAIAGNTAAGLQVSGGASGQASIMRFSADNNPNRLSFGKSRNATVGSHTIVQNGDFTGTIEFFGSDGTGFIQSAAIYATVDGTPGTNDMPGALSFWTTADGASGSTERMRITSSGQVGVGGTPEAGVTFQLSKVITGASFSKGLVQTGQIQSSVTGGVYYNQTYATTQASSFTLPLLNHYVVTQGPFGAGSTVTNQQGFLVESSLTGATNNYGFKSDIAAGTGRYNFYAAGSADNYFAGSVGVGSAPYAGVNFYNAKNITGNTSADANATVATVQSDVTTRATGFITYLSTAASAFTLTTLRHFQASQNTIGAGSAVTNQTGFWAENNLTGATNNFGFVSNIASGTGRWNFYAGGTADNYFAGNVLVGTTTSSLGKLTVITGTTSKVPLWASYNVAGDLGYAPIRSDKYDNNTTTSQVFVNFSVNNNTTACGQINANGSGAAAFGAWSDRRLKENIVDLPNQLENICSLRPVEFDYIESEGGGHQIGFIAQEMQEIYPDAVGKRQPDDMLTVTGWSKTEARLVKAIQELHSEVQSLKAELATLKGN